jgi:hypothetical protein
LRHTLAQAGLLRHTLAQEGLLRHTLAQAGLLRHTLAQAGLLRHVKNWEENKNTQRKPRPSASSSVTKSKPSSLAYEAATNP